MVVIAGEGCDAGSAVREGGGAAADRQTLPVSLPGQRAVQHV